MWTHFHWIFNCLRLSLKNIPISPIIPIFQILSEFYQISRCDFQKTEWYVKHANNTYHLKTAWKYQVELFLLYFVYSVTSQVGFTGVPSQKDQNTNNFRIFHPNIFKLGTCANLHNFNLLGEFCDVGFFSKWYVVKLLQKYPETKLQLKTCKKTP